MPNGDSERPWPGSWHAKEASDAIPRATTTLFVVAIATLSFPRVPPIPWDRSSLEVHRIGRDLWPRLQTLAWKQAVCRG